MAGMTLGASAPEAAGQLVPTTERSRARSGVPAGPPSLPGIHVDTREEYYDLPDSTLTGVVRRLNGMHLQGPEGPPSQGLTTYQIRPEWSALAQGGRCHVRAVEVFATITITLPRWPRVFDRPVGERERWASIDRAIREHEYLHRDLVVEAAGEILEEIRGLDAQGCAVLRRVVGSTLSIADERLDEAHIELDATTPRRLSIRGPGGRR
ncbi:MAG: DUF922 domain-containing protein [Gemmatimonadota bacterium]